MSWNAKRFKQNSNWHHIPPKHPAQSTPFKIRVNKRDHQAYHQLFANARTFEDCVAILWRNWWAPYYAAKGEDHDPCQRLERPYSAETAA